MVPLLLLFISPCPAQDETRVLAGELNDKQKQNLEQIARIPHIDPQDKRFLEKYIREQFDLDLRKPLQPGAKIDSISVNAVQTEVADLLLRNRWPADHERLEELTRDWTFEKTIRDLMPFLMARQEDKHDGAFWSSAVAYRLMFLGRRLQPLIHHLLTADDLQFRHIGIKLASLYAWRSEEVPAFGMETDARLILDIVRNSEKEDVISDGFSALNYYNYVTEEAILLAKNVLLQGKLTNRGFVSGYLRDAWSSSARYSSEELTGNIQADTPPKEVLEYLENSNREYGPQTIKHIADLIRKQAPGNPKAELPEWQVKDLLRYVFWSGQMHQHRDLFRLFHPTKPAEAIAWYFASKQATDPGDIPQLIQSYAHIDKNAFREHADYAKAIIHLSAFAPDRDWTDLKALTNQGKEASRLWASYAYWRITKDKGPLEAAIGRINWEDRQSDGAHYIDDILSLHPDEAFRYVEKLSRMSGPFEQGLSGPYLQLLYRLTDNPRQVCAKLNAYISGIEGETLSIDELWDTIRLLGPRAAPTVPVLAGILNKKRPQGNYRVRYACEVIADIGIHADTRALLPKLREILEDPGAGPAHRPAGLTLYLLSGDPNPAIEVLLRQAEMGGWMQVWSMRYLRMIGTDAVTALPRLRYWKEHSLSAAIRREATLAIQAIEDPKENGEEQLLEFWDVLQKEDSYTLAVAIRRMINAGAQASAFISKRLAKDDSELLDGQAIAALIQKLGAEEFEVREDATIKLLKTVLYSEPALQTALAQTRDPEVVARLKWLLSPEKSSARANPSKPASFDIPQRLQQDRGRMILKEIQALQRGSGPGAAGSATPPVH
jgi:hypothetical protein